MLQGHREATRSPKGVSESIALCLDFCSGFGGAKLCTLPVHFRGPLGAPLGPHPAPFLLDGWGEPKHASHILQKRCAANDLPGASQRSESCSRARVHTDLPGASQRSESCSRAGVHRNLLGALLQKGWCAQESPWGSGKSESCSRARVHRNLFLRNNVKMLRKTR